MGCFPSTNYNVDVTLYLQKLHEEGEMLQKQEECILNELKDLENEFPDRPDDREKVARIFENDLEETRILIGFYNSAIKHSHKIINGELS